MPPENAVHIGFQNLIFRIPRLDTEGDRDFEELAIELDEGWLGLHLNEFRIL